MFGLIQFSDDNLYYVVKKRRLKLLKSILHAPYGNGMYRCCMLAENGDEKLLKEIAKNLNLGIPAIKVMHLQSINNVQHTLDNSTAFQSSFLRSSHWDINNLTALSVLYNSSSNEDENISGSIDESNTTEILNNSKIIVVEDRYLSQKMDVSKILRKNADMKNISVETYQEIQSVEASEAINFTNDEDIASNIIEIYDRKGQSSFDTANISFTRNDASNIKTDRIVQVYDQSGQSLDIDASLLLTEADLEGSKNDSFSQEKEIKTIIDSNLNNFDNNNNFKDLTEAEELPIIEGNTNNTITLQAENSTENKKNVGKHFRKRERSFNLQSDTEYTPSTNKIRKIDTVKNKVKTSNKVQKNRGNETKIILDGIQKVKVVNKTPLGNVMLNPTNYFVETSKTSNKNYFCPYCKKLLAVRLINHLTAVHKDEEEVAEILTLPTAKRIKGQSLNSYQIKRNMLISKIRKRGSFLYNCQLSDGKFQVSRRPQVNQVKTVDTYKVCSFCMGFYSKESIRKHLTKCVGNADTVKEISRLHNYVVGDIHAEANVYLRVVAIRFNKDKIAKIAKRDLLIVLYGNYEAFKYRHSSHHNRQIRSAMRLLARILIIMRTKEKDITDLKSIFNPAYSKSYISTADELGQFDSKSKMFASPASARDVGRLISAACNLWIAECIERKLPAQVKKDAEEFLHLHNVKFPKLISKTVAESQTQMNIEKGLPKLPSIKDIKLLSNYVTSKRDEVFDQLKESFNYANWYTLGQTTLVSILIFNRKRPGELSRLLKNSFTYSKQQLSEETNPEFYKNISATAKAIASKYTRILTRGKKNCKITPILLDQKMLKCIELILEFHPEAGITDENPYVFGLPSKTNEFRYIEASNILPKFAEDCGSEFPNLLRGTRLRKHVATIGMALNLTDGQVGNLSNFLAHDKRIHLDIYRQPVVTQDILQVSQWLEYAQGDFVETPNGNIVVENEATLSDMEDDDTDVEENNVIEDEENQDYNKPRNVKPVKMSMDNLTEDKGARKTWTKESIQIILENFQERYLRKDSIPGSEIQAVIDSNKCLKDRKVENIRSFMQWYFKKNKHRINPIKSAIEENDSQCEKKTKNRIPNSIYKCFGEFIEQGKIPNLAECTEGYCKSPTLYGYKPQQIQDMIRKAIDFDNSF